jgi:two-component system phosphate regulon sensor histidine kinase PhoR
MEGVFVMRLGVAEEHRERRTDAVIELRRAAVVVLLFLGVGAGLYLLLDPLQEAGQPPLVKTMVLACGVILCLVGVIGGVLLARLEKERIDAVAGRLEEMVRRGRIGLMISEHEANALGRLGRAVNRYLGFVKEEIEQSHMAAKERQIQMKVLEAEKRHLEAVIHSISDAVLVTDAFGDLILANEAAEGIFGFEFDPSTRRPVEEIIEDEAVLGLLCEARETGLHSPHRTAEWTQGGGEGGRTFRVILNAVIEGRRRERLSGVVAVLHDVTKEKEIARLKSDFVSNVSHELKAPLASIKAYVEMLQDGEVTDEAEKREFLATIAGETDRLAGLVESILNLSRLESGLVPINKTDIEVAEVLQDVVEVMTPQAGKRGVEVSADLAPVFFRVNGDRDMLHQAVLNVVSNAIKYTPEGGSVRIASFLEDSTVVVSVQDSGYGIPEDELEKIFEKFYRARLSGRVSAGTGLGLPLVKHVIENVHGGNITVESTVGKGTTFRLHLPAAR